MKYMLISIVTLLVCFGLPALAISLVAKKKGRKLGVVKTTGWSLLSGILILTAVMAVYLGQYYHAGEKAAAALKSDDKVKVTNEGAVTLFDGSGTKDALVFYPGAKVEAAAYAPVLRMIAEQGTDVYLVEMPLHMAVLGSGKAGQIVRSAEYENWYIGGHSLGGSAASMYAVKHPEQIEGLVLFASYSTSDLPDEIRVLSVYGSEDGVLNMKAYENAKQYWPEDHDEVVINGGNHAEMGDYGFQKGDNLALIPEETQWQKTAEAVSRWIGE